jgi:hypothetical protein
MLVTVFEYFMKINEFTVRQLILMAKTINISQFTIKYKAKRFIHFKIVGLIF